MVLGAAHLQGQASTATIVGTVTDPSGAAISGAAVEVKNTGTGIVRSTTADSQGRYGVPDLIIGNYEVQASSTGFQAVNRTGITLTVGSEPVVDFNLQVGQAQQAVTVEGEVSSVETQSAAVGALVEGTQMRELPLNGRNFTQLIALEPGVTEIVQGAPAYGSSFAGNGLKYTIAGARPNNNLWLLDGEDLLGWWRNVPGAGGLGTALGVEAIQEFQLLTNSYSAQYGGNGAVINASSKSGTNTIHGSLFEFIRNSDLEARNFFDGSSPPTFRRNQFGGSSVRRPDYQGQAFLLWDLRGAFCSTQIITQEIAVPDQCAHQFLNSTTAPGVCGAPVQQSVDPVQRQAIANTMALWPNTAFNELLSDGAPTGTGNAFELDPTLGSEDYYLGRMDYNVSDKDAFFLRYVYDHANRTAPANDIPLWPEVDHSRGHYVQLQYRRIISPRLINLVHGGFDRPYEQATDVGSPTVSNGVASAAAPGSAGIHPLQFYANEGRVDGNVSPSGVTQLGPNCCLPFYMVPNRFSLGDDVIWTSGAHNIKIGATATRFREDTFTVLFQSPDFIFPSVSTFMSGIAVVAIGQVSDIQNPLSGAGSYRDWRYWTYGFYGEDQWKVNRKLTVTLGLRYYSPTSIITFARRPAYMLMLIRLRQISRGFLKTRKPRTTPLYTTGTPASAPGL